METKVEALKEKAASRELMHRTACEWVTQCSKPAKEDPALRPCCNVCKVISEGYSDLQVVTACKICVAKAAAMNRIKAAGGDDDMIKAAEGKPAGMVKVSALAEKEVIRTVTKEVHEGEPPLTIVTVRVPYENIRAVMRLPPRTPLGPLLTDYLLRMSSRIGHIDVLEATRAAAAATLSSIQTQENTLAQFLEMGYATLELEVVEG